MDFIYLLVENYEIVLLILFDIVDYKLDGPLLTKMNSPMSGIRSEFTSDESNGDWNWGEGCRNAFRIAVVVKK